MKFFTQTYLWAIQMFHVEVQGLQIFHGNVSIFYVNILTPRCP